MAPVCSSIIAISERHSERHKLLDGVSAEIQSTLLRHLGWSPLALLYTQLKQRGNEREAKSLFCSINLGPVSYANDLKKLIPGNQINPTFSRILCPRSLKVTEARKNIGRGLKSTAGLWWRPEVLQSIRRRNESPPKPRGFSSWWMGTPSPSDCTAKTFTEQHCEIPQECYVKNPLTL